MSSRRSLVPAAAAGVAALALYVTTLAPGLIAIEDTPKFQFVGRILGTAHPPGYPFYVVVSHLFGLLPIGNLAWRINLLSAMFGALTVALTQLAAVELGVAPTIAALAALGLATGGGFWFSATIAEVYSLHGTLVALMLFALLRWRRTRTTMWFFVAIAAFSIGLGHHTSIVTLGPAVAVFAIAVAPRFALRPKTIASILFCFALGFSQYLFVLIRTRQGAWGEAPASTLPELFDVIRGARWTSYLAPPTMATLVERMPDVVARLIREVSWPAAFMALAGVVVLARRDRPSLALVLGSMAGAIGFSTFFAGQTDGFLQPAFILAWMLAAVGTDGVVRSLPVPRRLAMAPAWVCLAAISAWHLAENLEARDLSNRRFEMRYFDALATQLPPHSGLMGEDFLVDRMVLYEKFSDPRFAGRDLVAQVESVPDRVRDYSGRGYGLFAFAKSASNLRRDGLAFDYAPWPLEYGTVRQFLTDQPAGSVVAIAVPAMRLGTAVAQGAVPFDLIGGRAPAPSYLNVAIVGAVGKTGAVQAERNQSDAGSAFVARGTAVGTTHVVAPADILAEATYDHASIRIGSREIIRSREPVLAVWSPRGELVVATALGAAGRVPMPASAVSVYRLRGVRAWSSIDRVPADITAASTSGHVMVRQPSGDVPLVIYAARDARSLAPRLFDVPATLGQLDVRAFDGGSDGLRAALAQDGWPPAMPELERAARVYRIALPSSAGVFHLAFGGIPDVALSRWSGRGEHPALYGIDLTGQLEPIDETSSRLHVARDHHQFFLANGWTPISADETGAFAQVLDRDAEILLPCEAGACTTIALQLAAAEDADRVAIAVNGRTLPAQDLHREWSYYTWTVPADALRTGINSVVLTAPSPTRLGDLLVSRAR